MSPTKILGAITSLVMLGAALVYGYSMLIIGSTAYEMDKAMSEAEADYNNPPVGEFKVVNIDKDNRALWDGYEALLKVNEPVRERVVTFDAYVKLRELLKPGEEAPEKDFLEVFASARATAYADAECARLLVKLASKCSVAYATASPVRTEKDLFAINATLTFVQKDEFGAVEQGDLAYREVNADLTDGKLVKVSLSDSARQRQKFYDSTAGVCAKLRKTQRNCAIYRIMVGAYPDNKSDSLTMQGRALLSFLQPVGSS